MLQEIADLLRSFDKSSDPAHADITPSVLRLIDLKLPGALAVCDLLNAPQRLTRMRAQRVVEGAVFLHFGFAYGRGFPNAEAERRARGAINENGYSADAPEDKRHAAIERWRGWLRREMEVRRTKPRKEPRSK